MRLVGIDSGPFGIRANNIAPETILTERNRQRIPEEQRQMLLDMHPIKRLGTSEDVARAGLFLASDDAAWITDSVNHPLTHPDGVMHFHPNEQYDLSNSANKRRGVIQLAQKE